MLKNFKKYFEEIEEPSLRVRNAFSNLKSSNPSYYSSVFKQRSAKSDMAAGSVYNMTPEELERSILSANWKHYNNPAIMAPAVGFVSYDLNGIVGVIDLKNALSQGKINLGDNITFTDPKSTGRAFPTIKADRGDETNMTVILLGPSKEGQEVVWTFHPGPPTNNGPDGMGFPSEMVGRSVSVSDAIRMGVKTAKVI